MLRRRDHVTVLLALLIAACGGEIEEQDTQAQRKPLYLTHTKWPNGQIPVCWEAVPATITNGAQLKADVRRILRSSWSWVAKIDFTQWRDPCPSDTGGWVTIALEDSTGASASLGYRGATRSHRVRLGVRRSDFHGGLIPHEFGHILGFSHEHDRNDIDYYETCRLVSAAPGAGYLTDPDLDSVMTSTGYCQRNPRLSPRDIEGARIAYGTRSYPNLGLVAAGADPDRSGYTFWYRHGVATKGKSWDLDATRSYYGYLLPGQRPADVIATAVDINADQFVIWYRDGKVSKSKMADNHRYPRSENSYTLPPGRATTDIVGVSLDTDHARFVYWYRDGTYSKGSSTDADRDLAPRAYTLPPGYSAAQLVAAGLDDNHGVFTFFYSNNRRSKGTASDLDSNLGPRYVSRPPGYGMTDIVGTALDPHTDTFVVFYDDGMQSQGNSWDLDSVHGPTPYTLPETIYEPTDILAAAYDQARNIYVLWFNDGYTTSGHSFDLDSHNDRQRYFLPPGYAFSDLRGAAYDAALGGYVFWFRNLRYTRGTRTDLDANAGPAAYSSPVSTSSIRAIAWDGTVDNKFVIWTNTNTVYKGRMNDLDAFGGGYGYTTF
jgi:hypothetical protein